MIKSEQMSFRRRLLDSRIIKFLGTGILNTAFGYSTYIVLLYIGVSYLLALLISTLAGIVFNYLSFGRLVFRTDQSWHVFGRFVAAYGLIYSVNAVLLEQLINHFSIGPYIGQIICIPINVAINWIAMNYWVYKKKRMIS